MHLKGTNFVFRLKKLLTESYFASSFTGSA